MPSFTFSAAYASEAARTLHELARLGELDRTGTSAPAVIHDLRRVTLAMRQVVDQLAFAHTDPGLPASLRREALATADELHQAGTVMDDLASQLDAAEDAADQVTAIDTGPARQWVSVANLHGDQAVQALHLLDTDGPEQAAVFLAQWDRGADTDEEATAGRRTRPQLPLAAGDWPVAIDAYTIVANPSAGQIAMYRLVDDVPSMALLRAHDHLTPARNSAERPTREGWRARPEARHTRSSERGRSWFDPPATAGTSSGRGPAL